MEKKYRRPLIYLLLVIVLAFLAYFFRDRIFQTDGRNPNGQDGPDLENPEIKIPQRFKWEQYVTRDPKLMRPTRTVQDEREPPLRIDTDCVLFDGRLQPVIHVTYETVQERTDLRMDAALLYQGFEQNRFTMVYPLKADQRFLLAANSAFMADTASITLLGRTMFPVLKDYRVEEVVLPPNPADPPGVVPKAKNPNLPNDAGVASKRYRHHFQLTEIDNGIAYRIRVSEDTPEGVWQATREISITTPFCPNDVEIGRR